MTYDFHFHNKFAATGSCLALNKLYLSSCPPIVLCIGSPKIIGDSIGPITGSLLKHSLPEAEIFGTAECPLTAKEVPYITNFITNTFKERQIITVDSAVGNQDEIGIIRISDSPLRPGSGLKKNLGLIGNLSIQGIVAERSLLSLKSLSEVNVGMVYSMANIISESLKSFLYEKVSRETEIKTQYC